MKLRTKQVDNFFYKYFNDNIKNEEFIENIKDEIYLEIAAQMMEYAMIGEIDFNQFTNILYQKINKKNIIKDGKDRNIEFDK